MSAKVLIVCAWCFPGLLIINGRSVSHGICPRHRKEMLRALTVGKENGKVVKNQQTVTT